MVSLFAFCHCNRSQETIPPGPHCSRQSADYADFRRGRKRRREGPPAPHSLSFLCENLRNLRIKLVFSIGADARMTIPCERLLCHRSRKRRLSFPEIIPSRRGRRKRRSQGRCTADRSAAARPRRCSRRLAAVRGQGSGCRSVWAEYNRRIGKIFAVACPP
jgi:hypothetical protein